MERLKKQMDFIVEIDKLKNIFRQSLVTDGSRNENDAEHSWHLCMLAITLEEYAEKDTNIFKCIKMMLIHDIVEIYAGDTYLYDDEAMKDKSERELRAAEKIYGLLPKEQGDIFKNLWLEFEEGKTKEANFANILDRMQPLMLNYLTDGKAWKEHEISAKQVFEKNKRLFKNGHPKIAEYISNIINESIEKGYLLP